MDNICGANLVDMKLVSRYYQEFLHCALWTFFVNTYGLFLLATKAEFITEALKKLYEIYRKANKIQLYLHSDFF